VAIRLLAFTCALLGEKRRKGAKKRKEKYIEGNRRRRFEVITPRIPLRLSAFA
jgi:hypothetical protein